MTNLLNRFRHYLPTCGATGAACMVLAEVTAGCHEDGEITLSSGTHAVAITTSKPPNKVWLALDSGAEQVCQGDVNTAGVIITANGFEIVATIKSNTCRVSYRVC